MKEYSNRQMQQAVDTALAVRNKVEQKVRSENRDTLHIVNNVTDNAVRILLNEDKASMQYEVLDRIASRVGH
ncbi:hypothetical protein RPALISO_189 [Ruegeria phage RpAliso]|nr:hypothetical protein RPALISO_189 [Ruegeria phage RpAliso]